MQSLKLERALFTMSLYGHTEPSPSCTMHAVQSKEDPAISGMSRTRMGDSQAKIPDKMNNNVTVESFSAVLCTPRMVLNMCLCSSCNCTLSTACLNLSSGYPSPRSWLLKRRWSTAYPRFSAKNRGQWRCRKGSLLSSNVSSPQTQRYDTT